MINHGIYFFFLIYATGQNLDKNNPFRAQPTISNINTIDSIISGNKCIKNMGRRDSYYWYNSWSTGLIYHKDLNTVNFYLKQTNIGQNPKRVPLESGYYSIDDSNIYVAYGNYNITTKKLNIEYCGKNKPNL